MTPRERVLTALRHEPPDRTPRDFWAEPPTWNRLFAHVGHADKDRVLDQLGVDVRHLEAPAPPERDVGDGVFQNFWGERFICQQTPWGPMREDGKGALAAARSFSDLESFAWPSPDCLDRSSLSEQCRRHPEHALLYGFADVWQRPALVRGWEEFFVDMAERPEWVHFLCRQFTDFYLEDYTRAAEITRGRIDLYLLLSDLGSQRGPLISAAMFHKFVAPYLKEMTVLKAIATAGDFTDFAKKTKVQVTRADGRKINVNCVKAQRDPKLDVPVFPDDTVFVPRRYF